MPRFADFDDICPKCHDAIVRGQPIAKARAGWVHRGCANGADDE